MALPVTEQLNEISKGLDALAPAAILSLLHNSQVKAANIVAQSLAEIEQAAQVLTDTINKGGNIIYAAAGSSAFMGLADGLELPGTFGISSSRIKMLIAGNTGKMSDMTGFTEDDTVQAEVDVKAANISSNDCMICISASGTTPYTLAALQSARDRGAAIIGIANNSDTPILNKSDVAILLNTPPEIIPGSTRLGAGTAQKIALNMMSTLMGVHLGHVHDGYMVNLHADNIKLEKRACSIIADITGCSAASAKIYLDKSNGSVKLAIMVASGLSDIGKANEILESNGNKLRPALSVLTGL